MWLKSGIGQKEYYCRQQKLCQKMESLEEEALTGSLGRLSNLLP